MKQRTAIYSVALGVALILPCCGGGQSEAEPPETPDAVDEDGPMEEAGEWTDEAAEDVAEETEEAADETADALDDVVDE